MDVIKILIFLFIPFTVSGQNKYPKDTIYIKYSEYIKGIWNAKFEREYNGNNGIYFNIELEEGNVALFYDYSKQIDTLNSNYFNCYKIEKTLEEIREKEIRWIEKKFSGLKYKPYHGAKNAAFETYVIEVINNQKMVIYPVIWRNERSIP